MESRKGIFPLDRFIRVILLPVNGVTVSLVFVMMIVTTVDVIGRYVFSRPLTGTFEITEVMLAIVVFGTMGYCAYKKGHVEVDVVITRFRPEINAIFSSFTGFLTLIFFSCLTWQSVLLSNLMRTKGYSLPTLGWPIWYAPLVIALGSFLVCMVLLSDFTKNVAFIWSAGKRVKLFFFFALVVALLLLAFGVWGNMMPWQISPLTGAYFVVGLMLVFIFWGMWVGIALALPGILGIAYLAGIEPALGLLGTDTYANVAYYPFAVIPLFVLMGEFSAHAGLSQELYKAAYTWLGRLRGGLAMASVAACAGFAAVSGSSTATAATMGRVAIPEMRRYGYNARLATGIVASAGTMGILIPPSVMFVVYGIIAEQSIGKLFMAGIFPGILEAVFYMLTIFILCRLNPKMGPPGIGTSFVEKMTASKDVWPVALLFLVVIGGIYLGVFTANEAAGIGAFGAFIVAIAKRRLSFKMLRESFLQTGKTTSMVYLFIIGATILGYYFGLSRLPNNLATLVAGLSVSRYVILAGIIVLFLILGCFMSVGALIVVTVPIFLPMITRLGFDPIWFGIIIVRMSEIGSITPPVGLNVYVIAGIAPDVPMTEIYKGCYPFVISDLCHVTMLILVPQVVLFLPGLMH